MQCKNKLTKSIAIDHDHCPLLMFSNIIIDIKSSNKNTRIIAELTH